MLLLFSVAYVAVHFGAYALVLRAWSSLRTERGILAYHALSFSGLGVFVPLAGGLRHDPYTAAALVFAAGLHGVYSLSFLEAWSLSQGSYSLQILDDLAHRPGCTPSGLAHLGAVGSGKQADRRQDLQRLGLLGADGRPTAAGHAASLLLRLLLWFSNGRRTN